MDMVLKTCQDTLHVIIQLCQRNSRRMDENEREVSKKHFSEVLFGLKFAKEKGKGGGAGVICPARVQLKKPSHKENKVNYIIYHLRTLPKYGILAFLGPS